MPHSVFLQIGFVEILSHDVVQDVPIVGTPPGTNQL